MCGSERVRARARVPQCAVRAATCVPVCIMITGTGRQPSAGPGRAAERAPDVTRDTGTGGGLITI